jgi:hypothetical protein
MSYGGRWGRSSTNYEARGLNTNSGGRAPNSNNRINNVQIDETLNVGNDDNDNNNYNYSSNNADYSATQDDTYNYEYEYNEKDDTGEFPSSSIYLTISWIN